MLLQLRVERRLGLRDRRGPLLHRWELFHNNVLRKLRALKPPLLQGRNMPLQTGLFFFLLLQAAQGNASFRITPKASPMLANQRSRALIPHCSSAASLPKSQRSSEEKEPTKRNPCKAEEQTLLHNEMWQGSCLFQPLFEQPGPPSYLAIASTSSHHASSGGSVLQTEDSRPLPT